MSLLNSASGLFGPFPILYFVSTFIQIREVQISFLRKNDLALLWQGYFMIALTLCQI